MRITFSSKTTGTVHLMLCKNDTSYAPSLPHSTFEWLPQQAQKSISLVFSEHNVKVFSLSLPKTVFKRVSFGSDDDTYRIGANKDEYVWHGVEVLNNWKWPAGVCVYYHTEGASSGQPKAPVLKMALWTIVRSETRKHP